MNINKPHSYHLPSKKGDLGRAPDPPSILFVIFVFGIGLRGITVTVIVLFIIILVITAVISIRIFTIDIPVFIPRMRAVHDRTQNIDIGEIHIAKSFFDRIVGRIAVTNDQYNAAGLRSDQHRVGNNIKRRSINNNIIIPLVKHLHCLLEFG